MKAMQIDLRVGGVGEVLRNLRDVAAGFRDVALAQQSVLRGAAPARRLPQPPVPPAPAVPVSAPAAAGAPAPAAPGPSPFSPVPLRPQPAAPAGPPVPSPATGLQALAALRQSLTRALGMIPQQTGTLQATLTTSAAQTAGQVQQVTQKIRPLRIQGPYQRLLQAHSNLRAALVRGTQAQIRDAEIAYRDAERAVRRAEDRLRGPRFSDRISRAVLSTRFNVGGQNVGVSPLVGQSLGAVGLRGGAAAGVAVGLLGVVAAMAAATAALRTFVRAARDGAEALRETAAAAAVTGGNAGNLARLEALGLSPQTIQQLSAAVAGAASGGGYGTVAAARAGLNIMPGPHGALNQAEQLQKGIEYVAGLSRWEDRLREARMLGLDGIISTIEALRRNRAAYDADAQARAAVADPATLQAAADLGFSLERVKGSFVTLLQALAKPFLKDAAAAFNTVADGLREVAQFVNQNPALIRALVQPLRHFFDFALWGAKQLIAGLEMITVLPAGTLKNFEATVASIAQRWEEHRKRLDQQHQSAVDRNTAALNANSQLLKAGTYGGGPRTQGAIPRHLSGELLRQAIRSNSLALGYWLL